MKKFDAIIIGAGIAGLSSALTAVNLGMETAILEKDEHCGGIARDCFHTHICGLFKNDDSTPFQIANPGICSNIFNYLHGLYGDKCLVKTGKVETLAFAQKDLWKYFSENLNKKNCTFFKKTKFTKIISEENNIKTIKAFSKDQDMDIKSDVFVDATGCLSLFTDQEKTNHADDFQLGGYCMLLQGQPEKDLSLLIPYTARKIISENNLDDYLKFITISSDVFSNNHVLKFSVKNSDDIKKCQFIYKELLNYITPLSTLKLIRSSEQIHLRSCNIDINDKTPDTDSIVKSYWPMEKWDQVKGTQYRYPDKNKPFCISEQSLKDDNFKNLFLAGKSIKVSENIHASARVMGVCVATGEQAVISASNYLTQQM